MENPRQRYAACRKAKTRVSRARQLRTDHCHAVKPAHISMITVDIAAPRPAQKKEDEKPTGRKTGEKDKDQEIG